MSRIHEFSLIVVAIILLIAAGCVSTSGPSPLMTPTSVQTQATGSAAATGTMPPAAVGTQAAGTCTADIASDAANCGGCGYACPANALCQQGQCYCKEGYTIENNGCVAAPAGTGSGSTGNGCPAGMSPCPDGFCYELAYDAANCGICGNQCSAGMICSASTCTNLPAEATTAVPTTTAAVTTTTTTTTTTTASSGPSLGPGGFTLSCAAIGQTKCGGSCVNLSTSNGNCGSCGTICSGLSATCCDGSCTNLKTDKNNCGTCGHKCISTATCTQGACKSPSVIGPGGFYKVPTTVPKINPSLYVQEPGFKQPGI